MNMSILCWRCNTVTKWPRSSRIFCVYHGWDARHSCFHMLPLVECILPGNTRYEVMTCSFLFLLPSRVIQFHQHNSSEPYLSMRPVSFPDTLVMVPPGLYAMEKSSGDVDICNFSARHLVWVLIPHHDECGVMTCSNRSLGAQIRQTGGPA